MAWTTPGTATAGEVLTAAFWNEQVRDNSAYLKAEADANGLVLIDETDFTSSTSIVPGGAVFSADYQSYVLTVTGVSADATTRACYMRMRNGATSETGNNYYIAFAGRESANGDAGTGAAAQTSMYLGVFSRSTYHSSMFITLANPYLSVHTTGTSIHGFWESSNSRWYSRSGSILHLASLSYDRFELLPVAASTGTVRTYGIKGA